MLTWIALGMMATGIFLVVVGLLLAYYNWQDWAESLENETREDQ